MLDNFSFPVTQCVYINTEYWPEHSFNIKIPISSHTSAPSYDPIVTSKLLLCFLINGFPSLYKRDFLAITCCFYCHMLLSKF